MPKIPKGRRVAQAAVNALRALLEEHDHIVQEIPGQNDFGEDFYVTFTGDGDLTSDTIKVQVKGGESWRRGIRDHAQPTTECFHISPERRHLTAALAGHHTV
ncbi:DUF4365 domain-containing protein [Streptomyces montanus]|uniref:DUF4365 domain-containing protein n=1 Tax=Streptomyces montanus TaxID=2580423 RepID=UPI001FEB7C62|nr:DUF4365 domain-containing protein [Streptomyces montanus]